MIPEQLYQIIAKKADASHCLPNYLSVYVAYWAQESWQTNYNNILGVAN